jgi:DNA-binding CsgD family transcriptional regulator
MKISNSFWRFSRPRPLKLKKSGEMDLLTRREQEVVRLVSEGMKNREIAEALHITEHTVSNYLYRIFEKLGASTRVELVFHNLDQPALPSQQLTENDAFRSHRRHSGRVKFERTESALNVRVRGSNQGQGSR